LHFGIRETFGEAPSLELFIKESISEIRKNVVKIKVIKKIRDIKKFTDTKKLKEQINEDLEELD